MATYDIYFDGIKKRCKLQDDPDLDEDENFIIANFICFRIMIYCDECHDFLGERSKLKSPKSLSTEFTLNRYIKALEDIQYFMFKTKANGLAWYGQRHTESSIEDIINSLQGKRGGLDPYTFIYNIACHDVFNYINYNILVDYSDLNEQIIFGNGKIPMLIHFLRLLTKETIVWNDRRTKITLIEMYRRDNRNRPTRALDENKVIKPYIESETTAFNISKMLIEDVFAIVAVPFSKILSCSYTLDIYTLTKYVYNLFVNDMEDATGDDNILYINIDATQSGKNLLPVYNTLFDIKYGPLCQQVLDSGEVKVNRLITEANLYDPSPEDAISSAMTQNDIPQVGLNNSYNKQINILFAGVSIIKFMFTPEGNGTNLSLYRYFSDINVGKVPTKQASVGYVSQQMVRTTDWTLAKFKTMGDFLQIILFELWRNYNPYNPKFSIFMTMDIVCGRIASLITPYVVAELKIAGDVFSGLSMYLNETDKKFLLENLNEQQIRDIMGIISSSDSELLQIRDDLIDTLDPAELDNMLRQNEITMTSFGKYKKSTKKSTRKRTKQSPKKSTRKSTRRQSPKKSTRKQSFKKSTKKQKYSEKVIKLSKKYNIKLDKNVVKNLKKLLSLQKKAKQLKVTITKKNSKGKRVYKTINELTKEIVKMLKEKSKSTRKNKESIKESTKSKITKKKVTKQIVAVREKAKKLKIKLTKRTSTGKRLYKTNNELMKEIKRKTK